MNFDTTTMYISLRQMSRLHPFGVACGPEALILTVTRQSGPFRELNESDRTDRDSLPSFPGASPRLKIEKGQGRSRTHLLLANFSLLLLHISRSS